MNKETLEIEIKVPIPAIEPMAHRIEEIGGIFECNLVHEDHYYDRPRELPSFAKTDEALRLRVSMNETTHVETVHLTYKGGKVDTTSKTREEIDAVIGDGDKVGRILAALGFRKVITIKKMRKLFHLKEVNQHIEILLDEIEGLDSPYMELEIIGARETLDDARECLFSILERLGLSRDESERRSYLELVLAAKARP